MSAAVQPAAPVIRTWRGDVEPWIEAVLDGREIVGDDVLRAVERHTLDLKCGADRGLWFDVDAADARLEFCACLRHVTDALAGQPFVPEPAQAFVLGSVHGWMRDDGSRRYTLAYIEVGKKFGKTFLVAGEGLWGVAFDGIEGARVYSIATKEDQARLSWEPAKRMIELSPELAEIFRVNRGRIIDEASGSYWAPLGRDTNGEDGKNPSMLLVDELHRHPDGDLYNTVHLSMATRSEPLTWIITTAGAGRESFCWSMHKDAENIIRGIAQDDSTFVFIAAKSEKDDWRDPISWKKANPNVGVTVREDFLRAECAKAQRNARLENDFRRFFCNEWTEQAVRWLQMAEWDACSTVPVGDWDAAQAWREEAERELAGETCYSGLDLGRTTDLCADLLVFPPRPGRSFHPREWIILPMFFIPASKCEDNGEADHVPYRVWEQRGFLRVADGNAITSAYLHDEIERFHRPFNVVEIAYDPGCGARDVAIQLLDDGRPVVEYPQSWANISPAAKKLEALILSREIEHGGNPVLRWNAANAAVKIDANENIRPTKAKSQGRIDGIMASIDAIGRAMVAAAPKTSVYETRGVMLL